MATVSMPIMGRWLLSSASPEVMVMIFSAAIGVVNLFTPDLRRHHGRSLPWQDRVDDLAKFALKLIVALPSSAPSS